MDLSWLDNIKKFKFWKCPYHPDGYVAWNGDVAQCLTCGTINKPNENMKFGDTDVMERKKNKMDDDFYDAQQFVKTQYCKICKRQLDNPDNPLSENHGGDCLKCMAQAGDPECKTKIRNILN